MPLDPLSQAAVGAVVPQATMKRPELLRLTLVGALAGMAPDLDVLIRSDSDPLLFLEFHRQFTHSLLFIPWPRYPPAVRTQHARCTPTLLGRQGVWARFCTRHCKKLPCAWATGGSPPCP